MASRGLKSALRAVGRPGELALVLAAGPAGVLRDEPLFLEPIRDIEELVEAGREHR